MQATKGNSDDDYAPPTNRHLGEPLPVRDHGPVHPMTYPDREPRTFNDRSMVTVFVVLALLVYLAFAFEASFRNRVCISAAQVEMGGSVTSTPVICR